MLSDLTKQRLQPQQRITVDDFLRSDYFNDIQVATATVSLSVLTPLICRSGPSSTWLLSSRKISSQGWRKTTRISSRISTEPFVRIAFLKRLPQALHLFDDKTVVCVFARRGVRPLLLCAPLLQAEQRILPPLLMQLNDPSGAVFAIPSVLKIAHTLETPVFVKAWKASMCVLLPT